MTVMLCGLTEIRMEMGLQLMMLPITFSVLFYTLAKEKKKRRKAWLTDDTGKKTQKLPAFIPYFFPLVTRNFFPCTLCSNEYPCIVTFQLWCDRH